MGYEEIMLVDDDPRLKGCNGIYARAIDCCNSGGLSESICREAIMSTVE